MFNLMRNRFLAAFITFHMILFVTSPAMGGLIPSQDSSQIDRQEIQKDMDKIQQALETKQVQEKLKDYGLTSEEVSSRLSTMTPEQIHILATASDDVLAGGDGFLGTLIAILVIIILIIVILKLSDKQVIIKMTGNDDINCLILPALC
jgi:hypothetical protein